MTNSLGQWIAGNLYYVFLCAESDYEVKNIKKLRHRLTHAAFCCKNGLNLLQMAADLKVLNESI